MHQCNVPRKITCGFSQVLCTSRHDDLPATKYSLLIPNVCDCYRPGKVRKLGQSSSQSLFLALLMATLIYVHEIASIIRVSDMNSNITT